MVVVTIIVCACVPTGYAISRPVMRTLNAFGIH